MLLTLENIQNQQFNQRFRGYDMAEVDAFLDKVAESYLFLSTENSKLKEELTTIKNERDQSFEEEQRFKNAIISAQSFADDIKEKAEDHAARLEADAKEKSTAILEEAQEEVTTLQDQISILAGEKERIKDELRTFLTTYLSQIEDDSLAQPQTSPPADVVSMDQVSEFMDSSTADEQEPDEPDSDEPEPDEEKLKMETADLSEEEKDDAEEDDVAILYEKIDLNDDFSTAELSEIENAEPPLAMDMKIDQDPELPDNDSDNPDITDDLEGDMLYSLDDPLDNPEPAVIIDPLDDEKK
jgi:cell division initiation protein